MKNEENVAPLVLKEALASLIGLWEVLEEEGMKVAEEDLEETGVQDGIKLLCL